LNPIAILLTHGHFDHFHGAGDLQKQYHIPVFIHEGDIDMLENNRLNGADEFKVPVVYSVDGSPLYDGQILFPEIFSIEVVHTPFHTKGSSCYLMKKEGFIFTGDTLFKNSIGRSDLPTGSFRAVIPSLEKLQALDEKIIVYPGHGQKTTIGEELRFNRYFKKRMNY
jgi:glyoxylase-like metal-dependent hydrolase (beta-lactamase superfamily II)